jgi:hypothetical protein
MLDTAWGSRDGVSAGERRDRCSGYARVAQEEAGPLTKESVGVDPFTAPSRNAAAAAAPESLKCLQLAKSLNSSVPPLL